MSGLREYERQAITVLTAGVLSEQTLAEVLESEVVSVEHTGVGYFATVKHTSLPKQHIICHEPMVFGTEGDLTVGFLVILKGQELTLECHLGTGESVPLDVRERGLKIKPAP